MHKENVLSLYTFFEWAFSTDERTFLSRIASAKNNYRAIRHFESRSSSEQKKNKIKEKEKRKKNLL